MTRLLTVRDLHVSIPTSAGVLRAVRGVSFDLNKGETLCIVGESGCGKSMLSLAVMGLLPPRAQRQAATIDFGGQSLLGLDARRMADIRGARMSMIFQEPMTSLNPVYSIGEQLVETYTRHNAGATRTEARKRAEEMLQRVGISAADRRMKQFPHQLSGGQRQRVMIAMALMCDPDVLIADEPTTALDVTVQAQILGLLASIQRELGMGMILITHDLGIVARVADRVGVMYGGAIVETGTTAELFGDPLHPYTRGLLASLPVPGRTRPGARLGSIPGTVPTLLDDFAGCAFRSRCPIARPACAAAPVPVHEVAAGRAYACVEPPEPLRQRNLWVSEGAA